MIQENIFREKMAVLEICVNAILPPEKIDIFYQVISPRMTTEGFLNSVEKILSGEVKLFGPITTADIISACDQYLTMKEKTNILIDRAKVKAFKIYEQTDSPEYEKIIIELYGSREEFEKWKEEIKTREEPIEYWRKQHKDNFIQMAKKVIEIESFEEYGIEPKEAQGLLT